MPELIDHDVTGFLVDDGAQAIRAVARAGTLDRSQIRQRTVVRFGQDRMVEEYLAAYTLLLRSRPRALTEHLSAVSPASGSAPRGTSAPRRSS